MDLNFLSLFSKQAALAAVDNETTFFEDVLAYFNEAMQFNNINIGNGQLVSFPILLIGLFIGAAFAIIATVYNKRVLGDFVRALLREGCLSPETARDLDYLNFIHKSSIRQAVKTSTNLRRVVRSREEDEHDRKMAELLAEYEAKKAAGEKLPKFEPSEYRPDPYMDHFYIPEKMKYMADVKFEKKGNSVLGAVIGIAALAILLFLVFLYMPQVLKFFDNYIGILK